MQWQCRKPAILQSTQLRVKGVLDNQAVTFFMALVTLYALFGDDFRLAFYTKPSDDTFFTLTTCSLFIFAIEIILSCIALDGYFNSFYFWLDMVSTVSLITDIGWIWDSLTGTSDYSASNAEQASQLARAGRGARIGTKAGRITRVIRLVRLIRIIKLYKTTQKTTSKETADDDFGQLV